MGGMRGIARMHIGYIVVHWEQQEQQEQEARWEHWGSFNGSVNKESDVISIGIVLDMESV